MDNKVGEPEERSVKTASEVVDALYEPALDAGLMPDAFWNLSIAEVRDLIDSKARVRELQQKERLSAASYMVNELHARIAKLFAGKDADIPIKYLWDYFPSLYEEEKKLADTQREEEEWEQFMAGRKKFAAEYNRKLQEKQGQ